MYKLDLHTHSSTSPDGSITPEQYAVTLENGLLDTVAVTDHDSITMALELHAHFGQKIIIGEEITTAQGEIIGLFLKEAIRPGLSALQTAQAIKAQGGLVYIPHPFETIRKGLREVDLDHIAELVDIVEVYNGRAFAQNKGPKAVTWALLHNKATAASSDAHGVKGICTAYSVVGELPTAETLVPLLRQGHMNMRRPPLHTLLYPKLNRVRKRLKK